MPWWIPRVIKTHRRLWLPLRTKIPKPTFYDNPVTIEETVDDLPCELPDMGCGGRDPSAVPRATAKCKQEKAVAKMPPFEGAISAQEETIQVIKKQYLLSLDKEVHSDKVKPTLATVTRHFRLLKLTSLMSEAINIEKKLLDWINDTVNTFSQPSRKKLEKAIKKLEEVSDLQNRKWVSSKVSLDVQYALKHVKYMETKIAQFHDTVAEIMSAMLDVLNVFSQSEQSDMPCTPLTIKKKLLELPEKYVAHNIKQTGLC